MARMVAVCLTLFPLGKDTFYHCDNNHMTKPRWNRVKKAIWKLLKQQQITVRQLINQIN